MFASIADNIMSDFQIQADKMTYLSSIYYFSNVIFLFAAGVLLDRFSTKNTILVAMLLCILGTFILAYSHSFYAALFCRFLTGIGSAFCFLGPIRIASRWFSAKQMAFVTGVIVTIGMAGGMLAQYPLAKMVIALGWRDALVVVGWLGIGMFVIMVLWLKDQPDDLPVKSHVRINMISCAKKAYLNSKNLFAAWYASLMNMAVAVFGAMMGTLYLMERLSISKEQASLVNSMIFLGTIIGGPLVGWFSDKIGLRLFPMKIGALLSLVTILIILYIPVSFHQMFILFFLLGLFTSSQVISYALVAESSSSLMTAMAVSTVSIITQGGYIIYQNLFSYILLLGHDVQFINHAPVYSLQDYQRASFLLPVGVAIALFMVFRLKETYCRQIQE